MIRIVYFVGQDEERAAAEVSIDDEGRVDVVHGEVRAHGILAEPTRRRLAADVAATRYARLGRRVGRGASLARIEAPSGTILAAFEGDVESLAPERWPTPVARHARDLALVARATLDGTLETLSLELPDVVREEHLLLSFDLGSERRRGHTTFVYDDGSCERWKLLEARRGERLGCERARVKDVRDAHAAAARLLDAVRAAGPAPEMTAAHDPTDALDLELVRDGRTESWASVWGRASRNDAVLEPVNPAVPMALFDDLVTRLRALRDAPTVPFSTSSPYAPGPLPTYAWGEVTPVDPPRLAEAAPSEAAPLPRPRAPRAPARAGRAVEEIVRDLVADPPHTLRALEASIGTLTGFARAGETLGWISRDDQPGLEHLEVRYDFDLDHESPYFQGDRRDPALAEVSLVFTRGLLGRLGRTGPVPELLASWLGAGTPYQRDPRSGLRFGDHWFAGRDGWSLAYFAERPAWSIEVPVPDPRIAWLEALAAGLVTDVELEALLAWTEARVPFGATFLGSPNGDDVEVRFHPPLSLDVLLDALGIREARVCATDVHQSIVELHVPAEPDAAHPLAEPRLGCWAISVITTAPVNARVLSRFVGAPVHDARGASLHALTARLRDTRRRPRR